MVNRTATAVWFGEVWPHPNQIAVWFGRKIASVVWRAENGSDRTNRTMHTPNFYEIFNLVSWAAMATPNNKKLFYGEIQHLETKMQQYQRVQ